jgi:hypothetical protein
VSDKNPGIYPGTTGRTKMPRKLSAARIETLRDQIAHLKVLLDVTEQEHPVRLQNLKTATQNLMVSEAQIATFSFRIAELQDEIIVLLQGKLGKKT